MRGDDITADSAAETTRWIEACQLHPLIRSGRFRIGSNAVVRSKISSKLCREQVQQVTGIKKQPTIDIAPVAQWFDIFCSMGVDKHKLLAVLQCEEQDLRRKDRRISALRHNEMLSVAAGELKIPGVILQIGVQTTPERMGVVGHLMMNSATLLDAGQHIARFAGVLSETGCWQIGEKPKTFEIRYTLNHPSPFVREIEQASLSACVGTLRALAQNQLVPTSVAFTHSDPGYREVYRRVFGITVKFDMPVCSIEISRADGLQPIPHHQSYLLDLLQRHAEDLKQQLATADPVTSKVRQLIIESLPKGKVDIEQVSERLHMSRWTLARNLRAEGTTFNDVVREIRSELAARYLSDDSMSISEVGFLLGYSEPSAFQRAFRTWYACTPSEFRIRH